MKKEVRKKLFKCLTAEQNKRTFVQLLFRKTRLPLCQFVSIHTNNKIKARIIYLLRIIESQILYLRLTRSHAVCPLNGCYIIQILPTKFSQLCTSLWAKMRTCTQYCLVAQFKESIIAPDFRTIGLFYSIFLSQCASA